VGIAEHCRELRTLALALAARDVIGILDYDLMAACACPYLKLCQSGSGGDDPASQKSPPEACATV
jgi:hypothetical protein